MSATSGKVALVSTTAALSGGCPVSNVFVADFVGYGSASCFEGTGATGALSNTNAALRLNGGEVDTDDNFADFIVGDPNPHNREGVPPRGTGAAMPQALPSGGATLLTVSVTLGERPVNTAISVSGDLTSIGGAASVPFFDDGTHGDAVANDKVFSLSSVVTGTAGVKAIPLTISDTVPRTGTSTIALAIETTTTPIHDIQGPGSASPVANAFVTTTGIVTALKFNGVYVQVRDGETDGDSRTSEGVFVFTGAPPPAFVATGQEVFVSGTVQEFVPDADPGSPPLTEIGNAFFRVVSVGQPLPQPVTLLPSYTNPAGNFEQLERFEGMRVIADVVAIAPTQGSVDEASATSTSTGLFHAVIRGVGRPLREPGLEPDQEAPSGPDAPAHVPRFDGNPERLRVDSDALLGAPAIEIAAGQTITGLTGPLDYGFRSYTILPDPPSVAGSPWTPVGNATAIPVPVPSAGEFTVGHYNFERFFDDGDDPAVDDPVLTAAALNGRLAKASLAVRHVLRSPDILGVVEVENLSVLQRLAETINAEAIRDGQPDPQYEAFLEEGNDIGGIDVGFLIKTAGGRVSAPGVEQIGKAATYIEPDGDEALLNDRPSLALKAVVTSPLGTPYPVTVIVNHLRSLSGIDGADGARIREKRRAQAEFLAREIQRRQLESPDERIVSVGDYNAFQFSDGYVDTIGTIKGAPTPADQVVLASPDLVDRNLTNTVDLLAAEQRYSFSFDGNAQAIDHVLVNEPARRRFSRMAYARLDADYPETFRNDVTRPERLSDHDAAIAYFAFPDAPVLTVHGSNPMAVEAFTSFTDPGAAAVDRGVTPDQDRPLPVTVTGAVDVNKPGTYTLTYVASNGFFETSVQRTVIVRDTVAPALEGFSVSPASISPPNHKLVVVTLSYVSTDASRAVSCMPAVSSNESPNATGDGNTAADTLVTDSHHVQVRSERAGASRDRIYTIALSCADPSGNVSRQTRTVTVTGNR
jgi:predicted extracellular nuclease